MVYVCVCSIRFEQKWDVSSFRLIARRTLVPDRALTGTRLEEIRRLLPGERLFEPEGVQDGSVVIAKIRKKKKEKEERKKDARDYPTRDKS